MYKRKYFPNLDASRFFAFIPVFLTHCFISSDSMINSGSTFLFIKKYLGLGLLGLDYFFVLSGFLISWIILEEIENTAKFSIKNFYIRRGLRIFPLYFLMVFIGFFLHFILDNFIELKPLPGLFYFVSFTLNFYIINNGKEFLFFLVFFWSVSVEEQFYIFWALVLKFIKKYITYFCFFLVLLSIFFRLKYIEYDNYLVFHTISCLSNFSIGSLIAYQMLKNKRFHDLFIGLNRKIYSLIYIILFALIIFYVPVFSIKLMIVFERTIFSLLYGVVIINLAFCKQPLFNLQRFKWLDYWGKLSFGLYCYHGLVITLLISIHRIFQIPQSNLLVFIIQPIIIFTVTLLFSKWSYELFELKILKLKNRFL